MGLRDTGYEIRSVGGAGIRDTGIRAYEETQWGSNTRSRGDVGAISKRHARNTTLSEPFLQSVRGYCNTSRHLALERIKT